MENLENEQKQENKKCGIVGWLLRGVVIISLIIFFVVPFCTVLNTCLAKWLWWSAAAIIFTFSLHCVSEDLKKDKTIGHIDLVYLVAGFVVFGSAFIINFYETAYNWKWFIFVVMLILMPMGSWLSFDRLNSKNGYDLKVVAKSKKANAKVCVYFLFMSLFYLSFLLDNLVLRFIFGGIAMLYLFCNIINSFLNVKSISKHAFGFITDLIVAIALTVYLIYIIPTQGNDNTLQEIILAIVGTIYAGFIPLVGVAWTIKQNNEERKMDVALKVKPIIYPVSALSYRIDNKDLVDVVFRNSSNDTYTYIGMIKNSDNGVLLIKKIVVDGTEYKISHGSVLDKNDVAQIIVYEDNLSLENVILVGTDVYNNEIKYKLNCNKDKKEISLIEEIE